MRWLFLSLTFALSVSLADALELKIDSPKTGEAIHQALNTIAAAPEGSGPHRLLLGPCTYRLQRPLTLGAAHAQLTIVAETPGTVVISGGIDVVDWTVSESGIWEAAWEAESHGAPTELFAENDRRTRARTPNAGYFRVAETAEDRRTGFTWEASEAWVAPLEPTTTELVFLHDWSISRVPLRSLEAKTRSLAVQAPIGCSADHYAIDHFEKHPRFFLEGDVAFLDAAGEWAWDVEGSQLLYRPHPGETPDTFSATVPVLDKLLTVRGDAASRVNGLRFEGLSFRHVKWAIPPGGYAEGQAGIHEIRPELKSAPDAWKGAGREMVPAAMTVEWADDVVFENCHFASFGGSGLWFGEGCRGGQVLRSHVEDVSANGLMIGAIRDEEDASRIATDMRIEDCLVERCGARFFGGVGIWAGFTRDSQIAWNEVRDLPYTGISAGWRWNPTPTAARGITIERNHIHTVMQKLSDGAGIYTLGFHPDSVIRGNRIHGVPLNAGRAGSNGIFMDQGSKGFLVTDNLIYEIATSPIRFNQASTNVIRGNGVTTRDDIPVLKITSNTRKEDITDADNRVLDPVALEKQIDGWKAGRRP